MKYLIIRFNDKMINDDIVVLKECLRGALELHKMDIFENYIIAYYENTDEVNLFDLFNMINTELYLDVRGFMSKEFDLVDNDYLMWTIDSFLQYRDSKYLITEKDLLLEKMGYDNPMIKKNILKSYYNDHNCMNMLKVFFECNLNTSKAADLLYMHRNTLINKLDRFIETTGYDIRNFQDAAIIYTLIMC